MANAVTQKSSRTLLLGVARYAAAQALVAISTVVALWIASRWGTAAVDMIYLPAVLGAAIWFGFGPAVLAAASSALAYDYFFTEPIYTLRIHGAANLVDVVMLFLVAFVTSQLVSAVRRQSRIAEEHAARNATIAGFARRLLSGSDEAEIALSACEEVSGLFDCNAVMMTGLPHPTTIAQAPNTAAITPTDIAAAVHTLQSGEIAGQGSGSLAPADWIFHPIRSDASVLAALGLSRDDGSKPVTEEQEPLLESLLDQTALAIAREREPDVPPHNLAAVR